MTAMKLKVVSPTINNLAICICFHYPHCFAQSAHQLFACAGIRRINLMKESDLNYSNNSLPAIYWYFDMATFVSNFNVLFTNHWKWEKYE
jgi:hypothetical protein